MKTPPMIRRIIPIAIGLLAAGAVAAFAWFGAGEAIGVFAGGVVMLLSFVGGGWSLQRAGQAAAGGSARLAAGLVVLKLPILGMALWMLFQRFDPLAVVAGGSVVMVSIFVSAVVQAAVPVREEA